MPSLGLLGRLVHSISKKRSKSKDQDPSHNRQPALPVSQPMPSEHAVPGGMCMTSVATVSISLAQAPSSSPAGGRSHHSQFSQAPHGGAAEEQLLHSAAGNSPDGCTHGSVQSPVISDSAARSPAVCLRTGHPAQHTSCDLALASYPPSSHQPAPPAPPTSTAPIPTPVRTPTPTLPPTYVAPPPASARSQGPGYIGSHVSTCSVARNAVHSSNHPGTAHQPRDGLPAARSSTHTTTSRPSQELDTLLPSCTATLTHTAAEQRSPSVGADGRDGEIMGLPDIRATHNDGEPASSNQQGLPYRHPDDGGTAAAAADGAGGGGANGPVFGAPTGRQHHYVHSTWGPVPPCAGSGPLGHHEALELSRELHASLSALRGGSSRHHEAEHHQQQQVALEPWAVLLSAAKAVGSKSGHAGGPKRHTVHGMLGRTQDRGVEGLSGPLQGVDRRSSSLAGAHPNILTLMSVAPELRQQQQWDVVIDKAEAGPGASGPTAEVMGSSAPAAGEARAAGSSAVTRSVPGTAAGMRRPAPATGASTVGGPDPGQEMSFAVPLATGAAAAADSGPVAAAAPAASAAVVAEPADQCTRPPTTACSLASAGAATTPVAVAAAAASPQNPEKPDGGIFISSSTIQEYSQAEARSLDTPGYRHCDNTTNSDTAGSTRRALVAQDLPTAEAALNIDSSGGGDPASPSSRTSYAERMDVLRLTHIESFSGIGVVNFLGCFDDSSRVTVKLTEIPQGLGLPPSAFSAACSSSNPGQQLTVPEGPSAMDRHPVAAALSAPAPAPGVPSCPHCSMPMRRQTQGGRRTSALSTASSGSDSGSNDCVSVRVSACDTDRSGYCCCAEYRRGTEGGRDTGHSSAGQAGTGDAASETWFHDQCREALQSATEIGVLTALNHPNILQAFCYHPGVVLQDAGSGAPGAQEQQQQPANSGTTFFLRPATAQDYEQLPADATPPTGSGGGDGGAVRSPVCMALCCEWCDLGSLQQAAAAGRFAAQQGPAPSADSGSSRGGGGSMGMGMGAGGESGSISGGSQSGSGDGVPRRSDSGSYYSDTDWESLLYTLLDVAMALRYLHAAGLVHRAVEPSAVLLRSDPSDPRGFVAKLANFGLATRGNPVPPPSTTSSPVAPGVGGAAAAAANGGSARPSASSVGSAPLHDGAAAAAALTPPLASGGLVGPVHCIPPEAYYGAGPTPAGDVWAFGMLMWSLACGGGARPFCGAPPQLVPQLVVRGSRPAFDDRVPLAYRTLATQCWCASPGSRPTSVQLVVRLRRMVQEYSTK